MLEATQKFARISKQTDSALAETAVNGALSLESLEEEVVGLETETEAMRELLQAEPDLESMFEKSKKKEEIEKILRELKKKIGKEEKS